MTTVRCVVHPGWIEVRGPGVHAVVAAADRHAEPLVQAAQGGLVGLLEALTAHGLGEAPDLAAVTVSDDGVRVLVRGAAVVVLADGTRLTAEGRQPWRDLDLTLDAAGDEVVLEAPEPENPRGWRRPARLTRPAVPPAAAAADAAEGEGEGDGEGDGAQGERDDIALSVDPEPVDLPTEGAAGLEHENEGEDEDEDEDERDDIAPSVDPEPVDLPAEDDVAQPDLTLPPPDEASSGLPPAARVPVSAPPRGGLIDSVPWRRGAGGQAPANPTASNPTASNPATSNPPTAELPLLTPPPPGDDAPPPPTGDEARPADPETARPAVAPEPERTAAEPEHTVHEVPEPDEPGVADGHAAPDVTTDRGALHRFEDDLDRPVVLAVLCPAGHPSPPHAGTCRTCGREIPPQQPFQTPRPALGVLRISTGGVVPLDRGVLLGRAPRVNEELPANQRPHLLRVGGVERDISRNHAEVVLEGWHVLVRDLGSTNGTTVTLPGQEPVRLRPTEDQGIEPGAVITLADEVSLTYEVDG